jgi:hypothetical protein
MPFFKREEDKRCRKKEKKEKWEKLFVIGNQS